MKEKLVSLTQVNEWLEKVPTGVYKIVKQVTDKGFGEELNQGDTSKSVTVYQVEEGVFIEQTIIADSYGDEESTSYKFVFPRTETVTIYE